jgi:hypothetical protein
MKRVSAALGVIGIAAAWCAPAGARTEYAAASATSKLTLAATGQSAFAGRLTASKHACIAHRTVKLTFRYFGGRHLHLGITHTNRRGRYRFTQVMFDGSGRLYAKAERTSACSAVTSNKLPIYGT